MHLTAHLSEGTQSLNNKIAMNTLIEWICCTSNQMAYMIVEGSIDVLYHLCTHSETEQLKENLTMLIFSIVCNRRRFDKEHILSLSSTFKLQYVIDHILSTQTEKCARFSIAILIDTYVQTNYQR